MKINTHLFCALTFAIWQVAFLPIESLASVFPGEILVSAGSRLIAVSPETGDRRIVSQEGVVGIGPGLGGLWGGVSVDTTGGIYVLNSQAPGSPEESAVLRVDGRSGDRTIVSGRGVGDGPSLGYIRDIAAHPNGALYVTAQNDSVVFQIDPITGDRSIVSSNTQGDGPQLEYGALGVTVAGPDSVAISDFNRDVYRIALPSGDRELIADSETYGRPFYRGDEYYSWEVALEPSGDVLVSNGDPAAGSPLGGIYRITPATGQVAPLAEDLDFPTGIAVSEAGQVFVMDTGRRSQGDFEDRWKMLSIDPVSGEVSIVASPTVGTGPALAGFLVYMAFVPSGFPSIAPGDFNADGLVNISDYTVWRDNLGATGLEPYELGDGNGDGNVTVEDYYVWETHFGESLSQSAFWKTKAIPEPSAWMLLALFSLTMTCRYRMTKT